MTIILNSPRLCPAKAALQTLCNEKPHSVTFYDPSIFEPKFGGSGFSVNDLQPGDSITVVLDHPKRMRFARIAKKPDGSVKVE